jgi:hypothetical protein
MGEYFWWPERTPLKVVAALLFPVELLLYAVAWLVVTSLIVAVVSAPAVGVALLVEAIGLGDSGELGSILAVIAVIGTFLLTLLAAAQFMD